MAVFFLLSNSAKSERVKKRNVPLSFQYYQKLTTTIYLIEIGVMCAVYSYVKQTKCHYYRMRMIHACWLRTQYTQADAHTQTHVMLKHIDVPPNFWLIRSERIKKIEFDTIVPCLLARLLSLFSSRFRSLSFASTDNLIRVHTHFSWGLSHRARLEFQLFNSEFREKTHKFECNFTDWSSIFTWKEVIR